MRLNRWQRAWVVLSAVWAVCMVAYAVSSRYGGGGPWRNWSEVGVTLLAWAVPMVSLYLIVWVGNRVARWVLAGAA